MSAPATGTIFGRNVHCSRHRAGNCRSWRSYGQARSLKDPSELPLLTVALNSTIAMAVLTFSGHENRIAGECREMTVSFRFAEVPARCQRLAHRCTSLGRQRGPLLARLCCKSRKLQGHVFFAKTRNGKQSSIGIRVITLSKSPVSLT